MADTDWVEEEDDGLVEVCCGSCDGLIAYADAYASKREDFPAYCGGQWCRRFGPM